MLSTKTENKEGTDSLKPITNKMEEVVKNLPIKKSLRLNENMS